jgi:capsular exopolysaccharide synthesis family protein
MLDRPSGHEAEAPPNRRRATPGAGSGPSEQGLNLPLLLAILRRRRAPLLAVILVVPLAAMVALSQVAPRYTATGTLIFEPPEYKLRELQSILHSDPANEAVMASQAEIIRGRHIVERVAQQLALLDKPEFNPALRPPSMTSRVLAMAQGAVAPLAAKQERGLGPPVDDDRNVALLAVQAAFSVQPVKTSHVLEVSFTCGDRLLAAAAVNAAMDVYVKEQLAAKYRAVHRANDWLEGRVVELRDQVRDAEDRIAAYRARQGMVQGMHAGVDAEQISHLTEGLVRARSDLAAAEGRLDAAGGSQGAAAQAAIAPSVVQLRAQQAQMAAQLEALSSRAGPNHPDVVGLRTQLAEAQREVAAEASRVVAASQAEVRAAREHVAMLEQSLGEAERASDRGSVAQVPLNAMMRDAEASRTLLQVVLERIQETAQQAAIETPDAHEISLALPPVRPSAPRTGPMLAAAAAAGVLLGLLTVYVLELTDRTFRSGEDIRAVLGLPCFALIPEVRRRTLGGLSVDAYAARKPHSPLAEQVRALRAGLWLGPARPRIIAITAGRPAEGKTVVALALARAAAMAGERVLAIDCDIRHRSFGRHLHVDTEPGLGDVLQGHATLEQVVRTEAASDLHYISVGSADADLLGLLLAEPAVQLLQRLRREYDLVVLDAPPVAPMVDARVVAAIADATLFCVRWHSTPRGIALHALEMLEDAQAKVAGVVLTRVDPRVHVRSGYADAEVYHPRYGRYFRE